MLSREDQVLAELLVARGLVDRGRVLEFLIDSAPDAAGPSLGDRLVSSGEISRANCAALQSEAAAMVRSFDLAAPADGRVGEFQLVREIGRGGMSVVFEAIQPSLQRRVALKILPSGLALDPVRQERFLREARATARLKHPGIVPVYTSGSDRGVLFIAMELIDGPSLEEVLRERAFAPREAATLVARVARAVAAAHALGLTHRDLKPGNVLLEPKGTPRVTDFGLVHDAESVGITASCALLGTPAYVAPETAQGATPDARTDVYGLGAVLYALLARRPPHAEGPVAAVLARVLTQDPIPLGSLRADLPPQLVAVCERAMARDPSRRHQTADALAEDLEHLAATLPDEQVKSDTTPSSAAPSHLAPLHRSRAVQFGAGVCALLALVALFWAARRAPALTLAPTPAVAPSAFQPLFDSPEAKVRPALSPDGAWLYWMADGASPTDLKRLEVATGAVTNVERLVHGYRLTFVPDGHSLGFVDTTQNVTLLDLLTRRVRRLRGVGFPYCWSPDGKRAVLASRISSTGFGINEPASIVEMQTGRTLATVGRQVNDAAWSPDGHTVAFVNASRERPELWTVGSDGKGAVSLASHEAIASVQWTPDSHQLIYVATDDARTRLWEANAPRPDQPRVAPRPISGPLGLRLAHLTHSRDGGLWILTPATDSSPLFEVRFDRADAAVRGDVRLLGERTTWGNFTTCDASPKDGQLAVTEGGDPARLVLISLEGRAAAGGRGTLPNALPPTARPRWSPTGDRVAFVGRTGHGEELCVGDRESLSVTVLRTSPTALSGDIAWSPDAARLAWCEADSGCFAAPLARVANPGARERLPAPPKDQGHWEVTDWSPNGRWLVGSAGAGLALFDLVERSYRPLTAVGSKARFIDEHRVLFVGQSHTLMVQDIEGSTARTVLDTAPATISDFSLAPGSERLFLVLRSSPQTVWRIDLARLLREHPPLARGATGS